MPRGFGPEELLDCYRRGIFPMSDGREDLNVFLLDPEHRGVLDLDALRVSKSLAKFMRKTDLRVSYNEDFPAIIKACAETRDDTWISHGIEYLYTHLHEIGNAHSVEVWEGEALVGGLYGVSQGGAFFGESMFSLRTNASKLALVKLVERMKARGFVLLDIQFLTDHLKSMGASEIPRPDYKARLKAALEIETNFQD